MKNQDIIYMLALAVRMYAVQGDDIVNSETVPYVAEESVPQYCWNFTHGDKDQHEFYSPYYPKSYPNNTDCTLLLSAPPDNTIRLDFRDDFHIEYSVNCKYDFLEIRDGPFGYSKLIGKYCGQTNPPMIDSKNRFLWIRFKSDDSIEYRGFRGVYDDSGSSDSATVTGENENQLCIINVDTSKSEIILNSSKIHNLLDRGRTELNKQVDCTFVIYVKEQKNLFFSWLNYEMTTENDCDDSFIDIYEGTTADSGLTKHLCGELAKDFGSNNAHVYMRVFGKTTKLVPSFKTVITVLEKGPCGNNMFDCGDDTCIEKELVCNDRFNCQSEQDEQNCDIIIDGGPDDETNGGEKGGLIMGKFHMIILSVVGSFILIIVIISVCLTCKQHKKEQERRKHALRQEERQAIEYEMTNLLNGSPRPGHLRAASRNTQPRANGVIPGTSHRPDSESVLNKGKLNTDICLDNSMTSPSRTGDSGYTRYIRIKDRGNLSYNQTFPQIIKGDVPSDTVTAQNAALSVDRPRLKRAMSDKSKQIRSRTPSPRPDVVQEEIVSRQYYGNRPKYARTLSADMLVNEAEKSSHSRLQRQFSEAECMPEDMGCYLPYKYDPSNNRGEPLYNYESSKSLPHLNRNTQKQNPGYSANYKSDDPYRTPPDVGQVKLDPGYRTMVTQLVNYDSSPVHSGSHHYANYMTAEDKPYVNTSPKQSDNSCHTITRPVRETHFPSVVDYEHVPTYSSGNYAIDQHHSFRNKRSNSPDIAYSRPKRNEAPV